MRRPGSPPAGARSVLVGEIGSTTEWDHALAGVEYVVHLAALAHQIGISPADPLYYEINERGTAKLAESVARSSGVRRFLYMSSIGAVCTISKELVTPKSVCRPDTAYGRSKHAGELRVAEILSQTCADWCILRPTLVYGPDNPGNMLRLIQLIKTGFPVPFGGIRNRRSFIFVDNLVDAVITALTHPRASRAIFNVCDNEAFSTPELIERLARHAGKKARMFMLPETVLRTGARFGDIIKWMSGKSIGLDSYSIERLLGSLEVDNGLIRQTLGWNPPYTADEGFALTFKI